MTAKPPPVPGPPPSIQIRGARTHNLADIDLDIPRDQLVVITGVSGSGKSSLAFDTVFAEGQRRYVESLSVGARQFLAQLPKPDVDTIEGLSPTVALSQENRSRNPRSIVGSATEVLDFLRLAFARVGDVYSLHGGAPMRRHTVQDMVDAIMALPPRTKFMVLAPAAVDEPGDHGELIRDLKRRGFNRTFIDDDLVDLMDLPEDFALDPGVRHTIEVIIDRLVVKPGKESRFAESIELALQVSGSWVRISPLDGESMRFSERYADFEHGVTYPEITPGLFSFNSPHGACPVCDGLGLRRVLDPARVVRFPECSLAEGAIPVLVGGRGRGLWTKKHLMALMAHLGASFETPWADLPAEVRVVVLEGSGEESIPGMGRKAVPFEGVLPRLRRKLAEQRGESPGEDEDDDVGTVSGERIEGFLREEVCSACEGKRLRPEALMVRLGGDDIHTLTTMPLMQLDRRLEGVVDELDPERLEIARPLIDQARRRLDAAVQLGLGYLTLERKMMTLSGGEAQRVRLATQIGAGLVGVTYVLDEPSVGLHQRDTDRLIDMLRRLRDQGNGVLVVEHDEATIRAADHVVEMGPSAGARGGRVVAQGPLDAFIDHPRSMTAGYLSGRLSVAQPVERRPTKDFVRVRGAQGHNLRGDDVRFALRALNCVAGVSGSGKSTLVIETLLPEALRRLNGASSWGLPHDGIDGLDALDKVIFVDQSPLGRSARSNPATYTGIFSELRELFAGTKEARVRGYGPARFSFNVKGGRCETCHGEGVRRIEMHFLPDIHVTCQTCGGRRYNRETLGITYRGKNIAQILDLSVADAYTFFENHSKLAAKLEVLRDVGLGYLTLGQNAPSLSGGEAQRVKLARELARSSTGSTLFILDEPTTGLHIADVEQLIHVFQRLVDEGNTLVVIEHDLDVIKNADWLVEMGPDGGTNGGHIIFTGTPEQLIAQDPPTATGQYLKPKLA